VVEVLHVDPRKYEPRLSDLLPRPRWWYSARAALTGKFVYQNAVYDRVSERIESFDPDVVHAMHIRNWSALIAANDAGLPTVLSTYALELEERALAAVAIDAADVVHAISEFTENLVRDAARGPVETRLIHPSIDVSQYRAARERNEQSDETAPVTTMARFVDRKNIETVIEAWKRLDSAHTAGRDLVVAGDGPNREALQERASDRDDVRFPGWVNGEEKRELLARSAAFIMVPRRDEFDVEGFGIVYIEAQATETPVIGSKHGGAPEAIGDAGIVVDDENDPDEVADAIATILGEQETKQRYERNAADRIDRFDIPAITEKHVALSENLLDS
jgi:phosphatidylinositol alpha-1,6-mannosyltransferase